MATGARLSEVASLRWTPGDPNTNDVDLDLGLIRVVGKGRRERLVYIGAKAVKALDRYVRLRDRRPQAGLPWLWLGQKGRMTDSGIAQMLRRRGVQAGVLQLHAHRFRHTYAHEALGAGMQEGEVMALAGGRSRGMLSRYSPLVVWWLMWHGSSQRPGSHAAIEYVSVDTDTDKGASGGVRRVTDANSRRRLLLSHDSMPRHLHRHGSGMSTLKRREVTWNPGYRRTNRLDPSRHRAREGPFLRWVLGLRNPLVHHCPPGRPFVEAGPSFDRVEAVERGLSQVPLLR